MTQALQAAAKWKMRVGGAKTDTANVMDAFGKKAPLPKKGWFGGGGGGSAHTVPKPSNASMAENASMPDPALQMAMKWKSKAALPAIGPTPEQLHKVPLLLALWPLLSGSLFWGLCISLCVCHAHLSALLCVLSHSVSFPLPHCSSGAAGCEGDSM